MISINYKAKYDIFGVKYDIFGVKYDIFGVKYDLTKYVLFDIK